MVEILAKEVGLLKFLFCDQIIDSVKIYVADSGGPLQIVLDLKCVSHVVGVTSFGDACAKENSTAVYTRVSAFIDWIETQVWKNVL